MTIYVNESNNLKLNTIKTLCNENIPVQVLTNSINLAYNDIVVFSRNDTIPAELADFHTIIYEDFIEKIYVNLLQEYNFRHDYYYLKNALLHSANERISTLISGSSYGAFDIDLSYINGAVNLSSISQDFYYSQTLLRKACELNHNIKNIVICAGYYYFYSDLSSQKNEDALQRISNVYYPLLGDPHNCVLIPQTQKIIFDSNIINLGIIMNEYAKNDYNKGFFNATRPRVNYSTREWSDHSKN